jgi:hypothetical protein
MIKNLTDKFVIRRSGKIRSGYKDEGDRGRLHNPKHFLLHDAPQLIPVLGEEPTEIYFTVNSDNIEAVAPADLRWYTKTELMCLGDGETAAYFSNVDVPHLTQEPHSYGKSRVRRCAYRNCPEYQAGLCTEHIFLNLVVPQFSMASSFTLDSTSFNAVMNVTGALQSAAVYGGPQGQIFRLYKKEIDLNYQDSKTGKRGKAPRPVVHVDYVPLEKYESLFRDKIAPHDWAALMALRSRQVRFVTEEPTEVQSALPAAKVSAALPSPEDVALTEEQLIKERANHPMVIKLFTELAHLRNKPLTEEAIFNTAKMVPNTEALIDWLKSAIAADKKRASEALAKQAALEAAKSAAVKPAVAQMATEEDVPVHAAPPVAQATTQAGLL